MSLAREVVVLCLMVLLLTGCHRGAPDSVIDRAVSYLQSEYNPQIGLIRESPEVAPHTFWVATDNVLAMHALEAAGAHDLAADLKAAIPRYSNSSHGLIEVLWGQPIAWPPHVEEQITVTQISNLVIRTESKLFGPVFLDWSEYADLALLGALHAFNSGNRVEAQQIYRGAMQMWDGQGFADKAYFAVEGHHLYTTYKLALALYVARIIGETLDENVRQALLAKQASSGGFTTLYDAQGVPQGDTNTETTSYAILALIALER